MKLKLLSVLVACALAVGCGSENDDPVIPESKEQADLIIGLGLQVNYKSCNARLLLEQRVDRAYQVSLEKNNPLFVFAGKGNPESLKSCFENGEGLTEAQAMKNYLMQKYRVTEDRIILEEKSISTDENARNLIPILEKLSVERNIEISSKSLVTSAYHNHRQSWRDSTDNSSVFFFNRHLGEGSFVDGVNVYDASALAEEVIWSSSEALISSTGNTVTNSARIIGDVSGDGLQDVVKVDYSTGKVYLSLSNGQSFSEPVELESTFSAQHQVHLADLTGDGKADLIGLDAQGNIHVALNTGNNSFAPESIWGNITSLLTSDTVASGFNIGFGQLDGTLGDDLVIFADNRTYYATSTGSGFSRPNLMVNDFGSTTPVDDSSNRFYGNSTSDHPRFVADITGDGLADIVAFGHTAIYASINNGDNTFTDRQTWLSEDSEGNGFNFVTGSNHAELVLGVGWGQKYWSAGYPRGVSDVNGDGRSDIWAIGEHGVYVAWSADIDKDGTGDHFENLNSVWVYESKWRHNGENDQKFQQFTSYRGWTMDRHPRMFGDVNGNGRADLVGFGESSVFVAISEHP